MRLLNIEIEGFRGIRSLNIDDFKQINLFVGANNSGKTSILEAIFLSIGIANPNLNVTINNLRDLAHNDNDDFRFIFNKLSYKSKLVISSKYDTNNYYRKLKISPNYELPDQTKDISQSKEVNKTNISYGSEVGRTQVNGLKLDVSIKERHKQRRDLKATISIRDGVVNTTRPKNYKEQLSGVYLTPNTGTNLDKRLEKLIIAKKENEIVDILKKMDSRVNNISLGTGGMIYLDVDGVNRLMPVNIMGDGIRRILSILVNIYEFKGGIVLIDEIENGLHFSSLTLLWSSILRAAVANNVQVFLSTHNIETLKHLNNTLHHEEFADMQKEVRSYTIRKLKNEHTKAYMYDFKKFQHSIAQEIEVR